MIDIALDFLTNELNDHIKTALILPSSTEAVVLTNASNGDNISIPEQTIGLSLVNIEEERVFKEQQTKFLNDSGQYEFQEPELKINLYILLTANHIDDGGTTGIYKEGLKRLSLVIGYFQANNVFNATDWPVLETNQIAKLALDLYSYSFEQMYNFWSVLGISYLPSVLYKVRLLTFQTYEQGQPENPVMQVRLASNHRS